MKKKFQANTDENMSIEEAFARFILEKRAAGLVTKTLETYAAHFRAISKVLDIELPFRYMTTRAWQEVFADLANTHLSPNSIRAYSATIMTFLSWARAEELTEAEITLYKGAEAVPEIYTADELKILLKRPKRPTFTILRSWTIINLLVNSGCRAATIRSIQIRDVHLDERMIVCRHMKRKKVITIPLGDTMVSVLKDYMRVRGGSGTDWLFCSETGEQMSESALRVSLNRYNKARGVRRTGIHKYRHTFARMYLVDCGGDALKLQRLLGHQTLTMTNHYVRIFSSDLVDDFRRNSPLDMINEKK